MPPIIVPGRGLGFGRRWFALMLTRRDGGNLARLWRLPESWATPKLSIQLRFLSASWDAAYVSPKQHNLETSIPAGTPTCCRCSARMTRNPSVEKLRLATREPTSVLPRIRGLALRECLDLLRKRRILLRYAVTSMGVKP